jgi:hypothetical protein
LALRQSSELVAMVRLVYGESGRSEIGRLLWARGKMTCLERIGGILAAAMAAGKLRPADPMVATIHLFALLDAELVEPVVLRVREPATPDETAQAVARAVAVFEAAYGASGGG